MAESFETRNKRAWQIAIARCMGKEPPSGREWRDLNQIIDVLRPFMRRDLNHVLLPGGGGLDFGKVELSREFGCVEFTVEDRVVYLARPTRMVFEYVRRAPEESFIMIDLGRLNPTGVNRNTSAPHEHLVEIGDEYLSRSLWDQGNLGYDIEGREIPLPDDARLVVRLLRGKLLIVAKSSLWNGDPSTYDGRHSTMTTDQVRSVIENSLRE